MMITECGEVEHEVISNTDAIEILADRRVLRRRDGFRSHCRRLGQPSFVTEITIAHPTLNFSLTAQSSVFECSPGLPRARKTHYTRILAVEVIPQ